MKNGVMMQVFHWDLPADGTLYKTLAERAGELAERGVSAVWMPPACKGTSNQDVGYSSYDYWDLGEFDQKGSVRTKYGTREELARCIDAFHEAGIQVNADMVFNHKGGADFSEVFKAVRVNPDDRTQDIGEPHDIEGWTGFNFPGRNGKYSDFVWHYYHFNGVDFDQRTGERGIYRIVGDGKYWNSGTDREKGNFDYLMNADIDHAHPETEEELKKVSDFMIDEMKVDGFRYDALKHISYEFIDRLSDYILTKHPDFYFVGEYWKDNEDTMKHYLYETEYNVDLFDVPLHFNLFEASTNPSFDLRHVFDGTLVQDNPHNAVTFVDNHDSQPNQSLASWIEPWFKPIAYALILLRRDGYPCLFLGDYDGIPTVDYPGIREHIDSMLEARKRYNHGEQDEYFVSPTKIGWVRRGTEEFPGCLAVLISTGNMDEHRMFVGEDQAGRKYRDGSGKNGEITIGEDGFGMFTVGPGSVTWWTPVEEDQ